MNEAAIEAIYQHEVARAEDAYRDALRLAEARRRQRLEDARRQPPKEQ